MSIYAITGGAGFIGSHLADRLLAAGHEVRVLDDLSTGKRDNLDPRVQFVLGDVADTAMVARLMRNVAGCFHLAAVASVARSNEDWVGTHRTNQTGTVAVLDAARAAGRVPVVYASSAAVYGDHDAAQSHEALAPGPRTAYGADKLGSELHGRVAHGVHGVPTLGLRFFNVYGPRQDPNSPYSGVISIFAARTLNRQRLLVHGDGQQARDFIFVEDVVTHLQAGMAHLHATPGGSVLNVCTGRATTVFALALELGRVIGRTPDIVFGPARDGDIRNSVGDPASATRVLGVAARVGLADGLRRTIAALDAPQELPRVA